MRISRLTKIKRHRVFRDFVWPNELPAFAQYNVIYGWNGSGKTTLSSLFANLQEKRTITEGEVEFELDSGNKITGGEILTANVPPVRVFNRNFVARTIEAIGESNVAPIYFLGVESITQQKRVEALKTELVAAREAVTKASGDKANAERALDDFCIEKAKLIKEALLGSPEHANYDKRRFREAINKLKGKSPQPKALSNKEKERLRKQKELQAKPSIPKISISIPDVEGLRSRTSDLLNRSIVSQVIDELARDPEIGAWVQQGLSLHKGERETDSCRFCGNELSADRRAELEAHFNDAFASFQRDIEQTIGDIEQQRETIRDVTFPDESRFYDHLVGEVQPLVETAKQVINSVSQPLGLLKNALERKKATPFEPLTLEEVGFAEDLSGGSLSSAIDAVNAIIEKHETTTSNLNDEIRQACQVLEQDYVLEALPRFKELANAVAEAETVLSGARSKPAELENKISEIEREIVEHRRPAEELNSELRAYLGRDELRFDVKDTGYALSRGDQPALDLSEGERTAIAFLYFLKSLEDKDFDLPEGIVVIDDPVSSLDANALFSAFGYMKERTKSCHQLFILTHNFAFFRQVKNWFHHLKGQKKTDVAKRPARFYVLLATVSDGERNATLSLIDPLLEKFESEYHFLLKQVHDVATSAVPSAELAQYYGMPNIARRLIETFLAYRFPDCSGDLIKRFDRADFDAAKKTRILRLLNTYSHSGGISDPEHDPTVLAETREVMKLILELMQALDNDHYQGMMRLMTSPEEVE
jgi:wobble nucleotide-excising tRNase